MEDKEIRLIAAELRKLRDIADRLIATLQCPEAFRSVPKIDIPEPDCVTSRCRCNPDNAVPRYPKDCPHCGSENIVKEFTGAYHCIPCDRPFIHVKGNQ